MSELEQKNKPIKKHCKMYIPPPNLNRKLHRIHTSKYKKKTKAKTGKKKPKSL